MDPMQLVVFLMAIVLAGLWVEGRQWWRRRKTDKLAQEMRGEAKRWWGQR